MTTKTFKQYLSQLSIDDSRRGDFISDVQGDKDFPNYEHLKDIENYLWWKGFREDRIHIVRELWKEFQSGNGINQ